MTRAAFFELRDKSYKLAGEIGTLAETHSILTDAYNHMCQGLDDIDALGCQLGYLDEMNNETEDQNETRT